MKKKGIISLLIGVVTGATFGVLFSPDKGSKIRKNLKSKLEKEGVLDKVKSFFSELKKELKDEFKDLKDEIKSDKKKK